MTTFVCFVMTLTRTRCTHVYGAAEQRASNESLADGAVQRTRLDLLLVSQVHPPPHSSREVHQRVLGPAALQRFVRPVQSAEQQQEYSLNNGKAEYLFLQYLA